MIIAFDLDDTLYDELTYVRTGFQQVAEYLQDLCEIPKEDCLAFMMGILAEEGRGHVFDGMLSHYGLYSRKNVKRCLSVYRNHKPNIRLYKEAEDCLERFKDIPIYLVTDGNKMVQNNKIISLGLNTRVKFSFITHRYGVKHSKPSPHCFLKICEKEKVLPKEVVYIADNPNKDFVGIKGLGFRTVRVLTGQYSTVHKSEEFEADYQISSLVQLTSEYLGNFFGNNL